MSYNRGVMERRWRDRLAEYVLSGRYASLRGLLVIALTTMIVSGCAEMIAGGKWDSGGLTAWVEVPAPDEDGGIAKMIFETKPGCETEVNVQEACVELTGRDERYQEGCVGILAENMDTEGNNPGYEREIGLYGRDGTALIITGSDGSELMVSPGQIWGAVLGELTGFCEVAPAIREEVVNADNGFFPGDECKGPNLMCSYDEEGTSLTIEAEECHTPQIDLADVCGAFGYKTTTTEELVAMNACIAHLSGDNSTDAEGVMTLTTRITYDVDELEQTLQNPAGLDDQVLFPMFFQEMQNKLIGGSCSTLGD